MNAGAIGKILLAPALLLTKASHVAAEALTNVHAKLRARMSPINLQTISDIEVD